MQRILVGLTLLLGVSVIATQFERVKAQSSAKEDEKRVITITNLADLKRAGHETALEKQVAQAKAEPAAPAKPKDAQKHGRGFKMPSKEVLKARHAINNVRHGLMLMSLRKADMPVYDARPTGCVPPVGDQGQCGNCYNWSGNKTASAAQLVAGIVKPVPGTSSFMLSVQQIMDYHPELGGCNGGDEYQVAQTIQASGCSSTVDYPGAGQGASQQQPIKGKQYTINQIVYCDPTQTSGGVASIQSMKNAILANGYISVAADASNWTDPGNGTITGNGNNIDHAIGAVGWDDNHDNGDGTKGAWIGQNQWSTSWGGTCTNSMTTTWFEGGYFWIAYGADSFGTEAFFTTAGAGPVPPSAPTIASITPNTGPVGTSITITGTNLTGATATLGGVQLAVSNPTTTTLVSTVPTGLPAAAADLVVTTAAGSTTLAGAFTLSNVPPPPPPTPSVFQLLVPADFSTSTVMLPPNWTAANTPSLEIQMASQLKGLDPELVADYVKAFCRMRELAKNTKRPPQTKFERMPIGPSEENVLDERELLRRINAVINER